MDKYITFCFILFFSLFLFGCSDDSKPTDVADDDNGDDSSFKYLALQITCYDSDLGAITGTMVDVAIYNQITQTRMILGSSIPTGYFCSIKALDSSIPYRVELYRIDNSDCIMAFWDISYTSNPNCWVENYGDAADASCHIGDCDNPQTTTNCWGN